MYSRWALLVSVLWLSACAADYPFLLADYPPDTVSGSHAGVYLQAMPDLTDAPELEAAVSLRVPPLPAQYSATLLLRGYLTVHWQCDPLQPDGQYLPPVEATLRILANSFQCSDGAALCPTGHPLASYPLNLTEVLAEYYPPERYGTTVQLDVPIALELPRAVVHSWAQLGIIWMAPLVRMPRHSPDSQRRNEVRWLASTGPTPPKWETAYAVRDQHDILVQGWFNWTTHSPTMNRYFGFLDQPPTLALYLMVDVIRVSDPPPLPSPTPSSILLPPSPSNTTVTSTPTRPPWYLPMPSNVPPPPTPPSPARRELFEPQAIIAALISSTATFGMLALTYAAGRGKRYDSDVPIDKYLDDLNKGHYDSSVSAEDEDDDSLAEVIAFQKNAPSRLHETFG